MPLQLQPLIPVMEKDEEGIWMEKEARPALWRSPFWVCWRSCPGGTAWQPTYVSQPGLNQPPLLQTPSHGPGAVLKWAQRQQRGGPEEQNWERAIWVYFEIKQQRP